VKYRGRNFSPHVHIRFPVFLDLEDIGSLSLRASWNLIKEEDSLDLVADYGTQGAYFKAQVHRDSKGSNPTTNLI
jgi:hypothetical protein